MDFRLISVCRIQKIFADANEGLGVTSRQAEVMRGMLLGKSANEIAGDLDLLDGAIKKRKQNIFGILGAHDVCSVIKIIAARAGVKVPEKIDAPSVLRIFDGAGVTLREAEVMALRYNGAIIKHIGLEIGCKENTVKVHRDNFNGKTGNISTAHFTRKILEDAPYDFRCDRALMTREL